MLLRLLLNQIAMARSIPPQLIDRQLQSRQPETDFAFAHAPQRSGKRRTTQVLNLSPQDHTEMKQTILHWIEQLPDDDGQIIAWLIGFAFFMGYALIALLIFLKARRNARLRTAVRERISVGESVLTRASLIAGLMLLSGCIPAPAAVCETNYNAENGLWAVDLSETSLPHTDITDTAPMDGPLRFFLHEVSRWAEGGLWVLLIATLTGVWALMWFCHLAGYRQGRRDEHFAGAGDREIARRARGESPADIFGPKPTPGVWISEPGNRGGDAS